MSEVAAEPRAAAPRRGFGRLLEALAEGLAFLGGAVMVCLIGMSVTSITLRTLTGKPVQGDFEMVQFACAIAIAAFLPWCQMRRGNIIVDFFTTGLPPRAQAWLDALGALLLGLVLGLVAWRAGYGAQTVFASGERGMISRIPVWIAYAAIVPSLALAAVTGLYTAWESARLALRRPE